MLSKSIRPTSFDSMVGQEGIVKEMKKRSKDLSFPEVMILSGPTGVGKTTLAYIVAALLNDPNPIIARDGTKSPNLGSQQVSNIFEERFHGDVHFFDASSMNKEDVLGLERIVSSAPMFDKNKILIIDEAQELSKASKGVTLRLLEKKRKNVHIILSTMDINSFNKAVKDRGQIYNFKPIPSEEIAKYLFDVLKQLGKDQEVPEEFFDVLFTIADNSGGSVRNALQTFERCIEGEFYTVAEVESEFGLISNEKLSNLIVDLLKKNKSVLTEIENFSYKEFFYKSWKTILDAKKYEVTGDLKPEWKKKLASVINNYKANRDDLLERYLTVDTTGNYFREYVFIYQMMEFMSTTDSHRVLRETNNTRTEINTRKRVPIDQ